MLGAPTVGAPKEAKGVGMMMQRASWLGLAAAMGAMLAGFGCSSDNGGGSGGSGASSSSSTTTTGSSMSSSSGEMSSSSSGGMSSSSSGGMSSSSSGGGGTYSVCSDCTDPQTGAATKECKAAADKCIADAGCKAIADCSYAGCGSDQAGACCTIACFKSTGASQASIDLYKAYDGCIYCQVCNQNNLCDSTAYCNVFKPGGDSVCP
jgi:hypothetical protein